MAHAGGKVILLGEHAVVYGVPAIAAGLGRGATARARRAERAALTLGQSRVDLEDDSDLGRAFRAVLAELGSPPLEVEVDVEIPMGSGLGASAAIGVAIARAVLETTGAGADELALATAWERVFHGNPSGIDAAAAASGGCIWFVRGEGASPLPVGAPLTLAIAVADPPASTKSMVESVARLRERRPEVFEKSMAGIRSLVENAKLCIEAGDVVGLGKLLDLNQMILAGLLLSTEGIERACGIARDAGALGAKLTGAGGGGCVIALTDPDPEPVLAAWRAAGIEAFATVVKG
jgi:mevalonate kinase